MKGAFQATGDKADEMRAKAPGSEDVKGEARSALDTAEDAALRTKCANRTVPAAVPQQLCIPANLPFQTSEHASARCPPCIANNSCIHA